MIDRLTLASSFWPEGPYHLAGKSAEPLLHCCKAAATLIDPLSVLLCSVCRLWPFFLRLSLSLLSLLQALVAYLDPWVDQGSTMCPFPLLGFFVPSLSSPSPLPDRAISSVPGMSLGASGCSLVSLAPQRVPGGSHPDPVPIHHANPCTSRTPPRFARCGMVPHHQKGTQRSIHREGKEGQTIGQKGKRENKIPK